MVTKHVYITWAGGYGDSQLGRCQQQGEAERQRQSKQVSFTPDNPRKKKELPQVGFQPTTLQASALHTEFPRQLSWQGFRMYGTSQLCACCMLCCAIIKLTGLLRLYNQASYFLVFRFEPSFYLDPPSLPPFKNSCYCISINALLYKWNNHFFNMKGDIGMA